MKEITFEYFFVRGFHHVHSPSSPLPCTSFEHRIHLLYGINNIFLFQVKCIGSVDTTCRVTCLTCWHPSMTLNKRKRKKAVAPAAAAAATKEPADGSDPSGADQQQATPPFPRAKKVKFTPGEEEAGAAADIIKSKKDRSSLDVVECVKASSRSDTTPMGKKKKKAKENAG